MQIPIQNLYYILCYAWNKLEEKDKVNVSVDDRTQLIDLFAKVLINSTKILLKRGIDKSYIDHTEEIYGLKGKLNFTETLQKNILIKLKTICTYDEFSPEIITNQILVSTLWNLQKIKKLDSKLKKQIRNLMYRFPRIRRIHVKLSHFKQIRLHRNNRFYDFILNVCQIIHENILPAEEPGTFQFADFRRDKYKMNKLFEKFIFNFYKIEQKKFRVKSDIINWQFEIKDQTSHGHLPHMRTDISLYSPKEKIIIDAKFYKETISEYYGKELIKSANLYQLFSYLLNQESKDPRSKNAKGILLYPTVKQDYNFSYSFKNHIIEIKTVNLNRDWKEIHNRLLEFIIKT